MTHEYEYSPEAAEGATHRRCAACGVLYLVEKVSVGCPACLLRRVLDPDIIGGYDGRAERLSPSEDGRFDHFELVRRADNHFVELGRGAMGVTYRGVDAILGYPVAVKVINAHIAGDPEVRERFFREARAAAQLRHANVASVLYFGVRETDGRCFYAMEMVEGETVEARVRRCGSLPAPIALEVIAQVSRAMAAAEAHGLVHRDLKPSNLMLSDTPELTVKVIDFGLAKAVTGNRTDITHGGFVGTPAYASPEQFLGTGMDIRSDLYSLGVTLWEMLTGEPLFIGSVAELRSQHLHAPLPLDRLEGVPQPVVALLTVLLEKNTAHRFQSSADLLRAVEMVGAKEVKSETFSLQKISVARLPVTGSDLFGREADVAFLDDAWENELVNVVTIVAWGGAGKSTLVNHWLRRMAIKHYRSAEFVFGWSFYKQGTKGESSSADEFLNAALSWFGDRDQRIGTAWEKGERLAKLVACRRTLLILDGLEPLQFPPGSQEGRLREPCLQALLRELASFNKGLCIITTRIPVLDIADHERTTAKRLNLERLGGEAGAALLRSLGVEGPEAELERVSDKCQGHCLALTLLGSYLCDAFSGDIRRTNDVLNRLGQDVRHGVQARKVMESYEDWLGEGPELAILRLLGLFDRPIDEKTLRALLRPPAIPRLTDALMVLNPTEWRTVLARLRRTRLLAPDDPGNRGHFDTHPLVREYFGLQFRNRMPDAWKECHRRLFEYYQTLAPELPDNFREMEPLFLAAISGCHCGLFHDVLNQVYIPRIQRGPLSFAARSLGARGALLSILVHFFAKGDWGTPMPKGIEGQSLTDEDQLFILIQSGLLLTATRGLGAPEAQVCYQRAEPFCNSLNRPLLLHLALTGQWRYSFMTGRLSATMRIAERISSLAHEQNDSALIIGAHRSLAFTFYFLGNFEKARQFAARGVQTWHSSNVRSTVEEINEPAVSCLIFQAISEWHFGEFAACQEAMEEAIALAKGLNDLHGLTVALIFCGILAQLASDPAEVERLASEIIETSTRQNFAMWLAAGTVLRGWARSSLGAKADGISYIEKGIEVFQETGSILMAPYCLALKAQALHFAGRNLEALETIEEAYALVERSEERWYSAELHRLRGVFLAATGAGKSQIELSFQEAILIAREQKSITWAARAEASRAKYLPTVRQ